MNKRVLLSKALLVTVAVIFTVAAFPAMGAVTYIVPLIDFNTATGTYYSGPYDEVASGDNTNIKVLTEGTNTFLEIDTSEKSKPQLTFPFTATSETLTAEIRIKTYADNNIVNIILLGRDSDDTGDISYVPLQVGGTKIYSTSDPSDQYTMTAGWHNIAIYVQNSTNNYNVYVDGNLALTKNFGTANNGAVNLSKFFIMGSGIANRKHMGLDDVMVYKGAPQNINYPDYLTFDTTSLFVGETDYTYEGNIPAAGNAAFSATYTNNMKDSVTGKAVLGLFDKNNKLLKIAFSPNKTIAAEASDTFTAAMTLPGVEGCKMKAFIIKNGDSLAPLASEPLKYPQFELAYNVDDLIAAPAVYDTALYNKPGMRSVFYKGLPYLGRETRFYAYIGLPANIPEGTKVPAMVLVHGGGGTAYSDWVNLWTQRGYAAIAMDLEGHLPSSAAQPYATHDYSGPVNSSMGDMSKPIDEQWFHHASSGIILANSLLRSLPEVDPEKIGITGISWGGVLTSIVIGLDSRFKCAIPVYGDGYIKDSASSFGNIYRSWTVPVQRKFVAVWASEKRFKNALMPVLWLNSDHDQFFPVDTTCKSAADTPNGFLSIQPALNHSHPAGWAPVEIATFADTYLKNGVPLIKINSAVKNSGVVTVSYTKDNSLTLSSAKLVYSLNETVAAWQADDWQTLDITSGINTGSSTVTAALPANTKTYYVILTDNRGATSTTTCYEVKQDE